MLAVIPQRLTSILACPRCGSHLQPGASPIQCGECQAKFRVDQGVPIFVDEEVEVVPERTSNPIGPEFEQILRQGSDFVLNIGAGGTVERYPNCIEFEHKIFGTPMLWATHTIFHFVTRSSTGSLPSTSLSIWPSPKLPHARYTAS